MTNRRLIKNLCTASRWLSMCIFLTTVLFLALVLFSPRQLAVVHYKFVLSLLAGLSGYWLDRVLFPFSIPSGYLQRNWKEHPDNHNTNDADYPIVLEYQRSFCTAMLRQALIVIGTMLAVSLGL